MRFQNKVPQNRLFLACGGRTKNNLNLLHVYGFYLSDPLCGKIPIMIPYVATTEGITITVRPVYLDQESDFLNNRFVFAYFIRIENNSDEDVQLLRRRWLIKEIDGKVQEVEGDGVVGVQPTISPGKVHEYNSYCVLATFEGSMDGSYLMERADGERFRVAIPLFNLRAAAN